MMTRVDVVNEARRSPDGLPATEICEAFIARGYDLYEVQNLIRAALDRGELVLGPKLRLVARIEE